MNTSTNLHRYRGQLVQPVVQSLDLRFGGLDDVRWCEPTEPFSGEAKKGNDFVGI
jgi:hypothetical protein